MRELRNLKGLHPNDLTRRQRLVLGYGVGLVSVIVVFTLLYYWGMRTLEGRPRSIFQALNTVIETMTTTGYGADSPWETPAMNVFVAAMQVTGVVIGFVTLRVLVIPLFERAPLNLDDRLSVKSDHVVVAEYQRDTEVLLDELEELDVDYVLVESDQEEAKRLSDDGYQAIHGDPEDREDLERATIEEASMLITDAGNRTASIVLTALEANEDLRVISFTDSTRRKAAFAEIGVDRSVAPHALIGRRLAEKATTPVTVDSGVGDTSVTIREVLVRRGSSLHGVRIRDSPLATHPDLTLVAGWFDGELRVSPSADARLTANTVLVVAGPEGTLDEVASEVAGIRTPQESARERVVVAGLGEGGTAAVEALPEQVSVTTVDESPDADPDVVGDVTEPQTLREADVDDASALIVTVNDDADALLTTAMARALAPDVEILVRVTDTEKTGPAFRAGADYVLSIQQLCARLVAAEVHGERVMDPVGQIRLVRADASAFAGESLRDARRDADREWTVVAVARNGGVHTAEETVVESGDEMFVAGSDEAIQEFERTVDTG
ncbi:TrkA family potassium uptake protein [Haloprofundus sp. MHR1]|uniref:potassium channel family protein n=1 Tax=Haloprofundus sp. MHR1 TaxID=2572921 RepID=UPI0010BE7B6A|nr:NAD-binding protein [Haloprofundus sp. MHR1]QCJ46245.1 TrkA family potassium uptake protein [Haloprofundus sp. MHR1]